jgi:hypothetical protein
LRTLLAAAIPIILAVPLLRYVRGKAARVALPLLLVVTLLPVSTAMSVTRICGRGRSCGRFNRPADRSCI